MSGTIGIITNDHTQVFQHDIIVGVSEIAATQGYHIETDSIAMNPANRQPVSLPVADTDGVIVIANVLDTDELQALHDIGKPMTLVSHRERSLQIPAIIQNNSDGMAKMVDYVIDNCGRRELLYIRGDMNQHDGIARERIFEQRLMHHNLLLAPDRYLTGDFIPEIAAKSVEAFLRTGQSFDAIVAADYLMACAILEVLDEYSINVPDEVSVIGFGDGPEAIAKGLTTVGADVIELGRRAGRQLVAQIEGTPIAGVTWLNTELIERESCQPLLRN